MVYQIKNHSVYVSIYIHTLLHCGNYVQICLDSIAVYIVYAYIILYINYRDKKIKSG